ncbi:MAG: DsbA family protein [Rhodoglobus sp.]
MSNGNLGEGRLSKNQKREAAREKARILREEHKKKERRTKFLLQGGVVLAVLLVAAIIASAIFLRPNASGVGPKNMASDGIQLTKGAVATTTPALKSDQDPVPFKRDKKSGIVDIRMYVDYMCPGCGAFEQQNGEYITSLMENGETTVEIHPVAFLDRYAQGTRYSTRATNAVACVANYSPDSVYDFHNLLFANQPQENSPGLSDDELISYTKQAKVTKAKKIATCIKEREFESWVKASTARASDGPIPDSDLEKVTGTPTVLVNGAQYDPSLGSFQSFVVQAAGVDFNENTTPTPTPSP